MSPVFPSALALLAGPHGSAFLVAATKAKTSSASYLPIILLAGFAAVYFLYLRPRSQRLRATQQANKDISVGDKVMLSSGIIGHVTDFVGDHALVEIAPGTVIEVLRRAVVQRIDAVSDDDIALHDDDDEHGDDEHEAYDGSGHDPLAVPPLEASVDEDDSTGSDEEGK